MYQKVKRIFDIIFALVFLFFTAIMYPFIALAIKLSSPGPVVYSSMRAGKDKVPFKFYKFRTMHVETGEKKAFAQDQSRIFKAGKLLRRSKLDEFPQVLSILKGEMSVVGPRPMLTSNVDKVYGGKYAPVTTVKPGLTSYASLFDYTHGDLCADDADKYKTEILPIKQEMELLYVERASIITDAYLVIKTAQIIFSIIAGKKDFEYPKEYHIAKANLEK